MIFNEVDLSLEIDDAPCVVTARENQDEKVVKEILLKYVDGYTSEVV